MKRPLSFSLIAFAGSALTIGASASDLLDSPGPGYRAQRDQLLSVPLERKELPSIGINAPLTTRPLQVIPFGKDTPAPLGAERPFSEPIHLFTPKPAQSALGNRR